MAIKLKKPITLIGLMGAGKTTIGIDLAKRLKMPFFDSDKLIENQAGISVAEIFERDGEGFFRQVESKTIIKKLSSSKPMVLATGGGAFMNEITRDFIKKNSISIWLNADLESLLERLDGNETRPLLNKPNKREILENLIAQRYPIYAQADFMVDTSSNSRTIITNKIISILGLK